VGGRGLWGPHHQTSVLSDAIQEGFRKKVINGPGTLGDGVWRKGQNV
jgi:hypothetical protein